MRPTGIDFGVLGTLRMAVDDRVVPLGAPKQRAVFAMLLLGGYSRFDVWRQVIWAIVALLFVHMLSTTAAAQAAQAPGRWPLLYLPAVVGAAMVAAALWLAARPRRVRAPAAAPAAARGATP